MKIKTFSRKYKFQQNCVKISDGLLKKWSKRQLLFFFGNDLTKRLRQRRCARGKLVGVEEEFLFKSFELKVWYRFQITILSLGSLTFCIKGFSGNIFGLTKKNCNNKKNLQKSLFHKKKLFTERKFEKCCEAKKMHKGSYY